MELRIAHLYADLMNIYGDGGNTIVLQRRAEWRGIDVALRTIGLEERLDASQFDLIFVGGGQDRQQALMAADLRETKADALRLALADDRVILAVCGGYQLMGRFYRGADGRELAGLGLFDLETIHPGTAVARCTGDVLIRCDWDEHRRTLVGFENHGGRTYLGPGCPPLGTVVAGCGNNGNDGSEGGRVRNAFGTYLHGSLLPKNPWFADHLIATALQRRYGAETTLIPLDNSLETAAHEVIERRLLHR
ncbi:MAG: type 1 glutamine amidotransferase [Chloroflexota bacterium]